MQETYQQSQIGRVTTDASFHTQHADEAYFHYFGNDVLYSILRTIHPEEVSGFCAAAKALSDHQQDQLVIRMRGVGRDYRWMLVTLSAKPGPDGARFYRIGLQDICALDAGMQDAAAQIVDYRFLFSLMRDLAFSYDSQTKQMEVYSIDCYRNVMLFRDSLETWRLRALEGHLIERSQIAQFEALCDDIANGTYRFQYELETSLLSGSGKRMECQQFKGITRYDDLEHAHVMGIISTISPKDKTRDINWMLETNRDSQTDLLNKQAIVSYAKMQLQAVPSQIFSLVLVEIDDFKELNDRFGHLLGDEVLYTFAHILKAELGTRGIAGRIGDGIFELVLEELEGEVDLRGILRAIRTKIEWAFLGRKENLAVTCSMGAACCPKDANQYDKLFMQADKALYIARIKGKNRYVIYDVDKHGEVAPDHERSASELYAHAPEQSKPDFVGSAAARLLQTPRPTVEGLLAEIGQQFGLDGIHIYLGPAMEATWNWGAPVTATARFLFENQFLERFNADGVYIIDNANSLEGRADYAYQHFTKEHIMGSVLCLIPGDVGPKGLISFDLVNRFHKWSVMDANYLTILAKILAALLEQE